MIKDCVSHVINKLADKWYYSVISFADVDSYKFTYVKKIVVIWRPHLTFCVIDVVR